MILVAYGLNCEASRIGRDIDFLLDNFAMSLDFFSPSKFPHSLACYPCLIKSRGIDLLELCWISCYFRKFDNFRFIERVKISVLLILLVATSWLWTISLKSFFNLSTNDSKKLLDLSILSLWRRNICYIVYLRSVISCLRCLTSSFNLTAYIVYYFPLWEIYKFKNEER